ncbi:MAG: carboxylating nicotinate-nucleotide diphosphorylase [Gemmatimonadota bacterium]
MTHEQALAALIRLALAEDVGEGDWTTIWTVPAHRSVEATIVAKADGVLAGIDAGHETFRTLDPAVAFAAEAADGEAIRSGQTVARLSGSARSILTGERVALNLLQRLSGVATHTRAYVEAIAGTGARVLDTRKTTPGLRWLEKQAVTAGGGVNHRFGLYDMVLIKENHIRSAGGITAAVEAVAARNKSRLLLEVETTNLEEVAEALAVGVDRILFDNMPRERLREAVQLVRDRAPSTETEASGGVSLATIRGIAETGVDYISVGALTHSAPALDLSLLVDVDGG